MNKKYKTQASAAIHQTMSDLYKNGVIDKQTMKKFDESCLTKIKEMTPDEIREIREKEMVSQSVFAIYLNVSTSVVGQWERGEKSPAGASLKLLTLVKKNGLQAIA